MMYCLANKPDIYSRNMLFSHDLNMPEKINYGNSKTPAYYYYISN